MDKIEVEVIIRYTNGRQTQEHAHKLTDEIAQAVTRGRILHIKAEHPWYGNMVMASTEKR